MSDFAAWVPDEEPDVPAGGGFAGFIASWRGTPEDRPDPLTRARLAVDKAPEPYDDDERQANLLGRGYAPGETFALSQRLADCESELAAENEKIERGERRAEQVRGMLSRGQIGAMEASAAMDGDFGDAAVVARLQRRRESLKHQLSDLTDLITPAQERAPDPFEQATKRAHAAFADATRSKLAEAQSRSARREPRPFASAGGLAVRADDVECPECVQAGATAEESFLIHHEPDPLSVYGEKLVLPAAEVTDHSGRDMTRAGESWPVSFDDYGREISR